MDPRELKEEGDPLSHLISEQGFVCLDGGLATELEAAGHDLSGGLWSARLIMEDPAAITAVHTAYLEAGADVIIAATYQASFEGLRAARGLDRGAAAAVMRRGVALAVTARDAFWESHCRKRDDGVARRRRQRARCGEPRDREDGDDDDEEEEEEEGDDDDDDDDGEDVENHPLREGERQRRRTRRRRRRRPLVAASVGPYGAYLADGSEYRGQYRAAAEDGSAPLTVALLADWHLPRLQVLAACPGLDLVACETIPSIVEAEALVAALRALPLPRRTCRPCTAHAADSTAAAASAPASGRAVAAPKAWLSFSCRDGAHLSDGASLAAALETIHALDRDDAEDEEEKDEDDEEEEEGRVRTRRRGRAVVGVGVNCTDPRHLGGGGVGGGGGGGSGGGGGLLRSLLRHRHGRHIVLYPNR